MWVDANCHILEWNDTQIVCLSKVALFLQINKLWQLFENFNHNVDEASQGKDENGESAATATTHGVADEVTEAKRTVQENHFGHRIFFLVVGLLFHIAARISHFLLVRSDVLHIMHARMVTMFAALITIIVHLNLGDILRVTLAQQMFHTNATRNLTKQKNIN